MRNLPLAVAILILLISTSNAENHGSKEVLLDNEFVQVVRLTYPTGTESGMHTHVYANRVAYFVKGGKLDLVSGDKQNDIQQIVTKDGDTLFVPATTHNVRNTGDTEVIIIETEIK